MEILLEPTSNKLMVDPHGFEGIYKDGHRGIVSTLLTLGLLGLPELVPSGGGIDEMDLLSFVRTLADPTMYGVGSSFNHCTAPPMVISTLNEPWIRLFDEEGNDGQAKQGDSASGGQGAGIQPVSEAAETNIEDVVPRRQEKRKSVIVDSDEPSHPTKN
ncbi:hypothetical protein Tco_0700383 [Tanacetum coccineum]